jgi:hypothetical protein
MARKRDFLRNARGELRKIASAKILAQAEIAREESLDELIKDVVTHPVSRALTSHSEALMPKPGTLFGFLGFRAGRQPVQELVAFLRSKAGVRTSVPQTAIGGTTGLIGRVSLPSDQDLVKAGITTDDWGDGRSWPEMIETSVPGLGNYLARESGRSQEGWQVKNKVWPTEDFKEIEYLTPIFKKFQATFLRKLRKYTRY